MQMIGLRVLALASVLLLTCALTGYGQFMDCSHDCKEWGAVVVDTGSGIYCWRFEKADCEWCVWAGGGGCPKPGLATHSCVEIKGVKQRYRVPKKCNIHCLWQPKGAAAATETEPAGDYKAYVRDAMACVPGE